MSFDRLIILPCHSIWKGGGVVPEQGEIQKLSKGEDRNEWFLAPFQIEGRDHLCFINHIEKCFEELRNHPNALLVISGGQTKKEAGPVSEAFSYYQLARRLYGQTAENQLFDRIVVEEYARDSFENVLFSFCRFYELTNSYPTHASVVGFEFKRKRFLESHLREALNYRRNVDYIGNSPTPGSEIDQEAYFLDLQASEEKHALCHFQSDWYGIKAPLRTKRLQRDPFSRYHGYETSNPKLGNFLKSLRGDNSEISNEEIREKLEGVW